MISLRKKIDESEQMVGALRAMCSAFVQLVTSLPRAALPANPDLSEQCKGSLEPFTKALAGTPTVPAIDAATQKAMERVEAIFHSNRAAFEERDQILKDVVASVAETMNSFKGRGVDQESSLVRLADGFEVLSKVEDPNELRAQLRAQVVVLRESAELMRRENEKSILQFESQISSYQQRLDAARKATGIDRLTGLGSRREAEKHMRRILEFDGPICVLLFDVEGFGEINAKWGTPFGDKLLRALSHALCNWFSQPNSVFRWGADEFLVIAEGPLQRGSDLARNACTAFANDRKYVTKADNGAHVTLAAQVACGAAQYTRGETIEDLCKRSRAVLDANRKKP